MTTFRDLLQGEMNLDFQVIILFLLAARGTQKKKAQMQMILQLSN